MRIQAILTKPTTEDLKRAIDRARDMAPNMRARVMWHIRDGTVTVLAGTGTPTNPFWVELDSWDITDYHRQPNMKEIWKRADQYQSCYDRLVVDAIQQADRGMIVV